MLQRSHTPCFIKAYTLINEITSTIYISLLFNIYCFMNLITCSINAYAYCIYKYKNIQFLPITFIVICVYKV